MLYIFNENIVYDDAQCSLTKEGANKSPNAKKRLCK